MTDHAPHCPSAPEEDVSDRGTTREAITGREWPLRTIRYVLPAAVVIAGLVVMALGSEGELEGGAGIVSAGLAIYLLNWLLRIGVAGDHERELEDAARDYFDRHGRWPD
jgi:hypothetical protein